MMAKVMRSSRLLPAGGLALLLLAFSFLATRRIPSGPYSYDEADYMYAVSQGFFANWFDAPSLSVLEFAQLGLGAARNKDRRSELSETIRNSGDIHFYRHSHGPLYYYTLMPLQRWVHQEQVMRGIGLWIPAAGIVLLYFGCLWLCPGEPVAALLAAGLYGLGYSVVAVPELAPHQLFVVLSLTALLFLAKLDLTGERRWWGAAVAAVAASFATLEVAFVGIAVLLFYAWRTRHKLGLSIAFGLRSLALFVGVALVLWPAGILKLAPLRSYMFMGYLALFRKGAWGDVTLAQTWAARFHSEPVEWSLLVAAALLWWRLRDSALKRAALPFLLFGGWMLLVMFKVYAEGPRYALPFLASLLVFTGFTLAAALRSWPVSRQVLAASGCLLAVGLGTGRYLAGRAPEDLANRTVLASVQAANLDGRQLAAPQMSVPLLHYYFPRIKLRPYRNPAELAGAMAGADALLEEGSPPVVRRLR